MNRLPPLCLICTRRHEGLRKCDVYKSGIPQAIIDGTVLHTKKFGAQKTDDVFELDEEASFETDLTFDDLARKS